MDNIYVHSIYSAQPTPPYTTANRVVLCQQIDAINNLMWQSQYPSQQVVQQAANFLLQYDTAVRQQLGQCAWAYACAPTAIGALPWSECLHRLTRALANALDGNNNASQLVVAREQWAKFNLAVQSGCAGVLPDGRLGARWVVRQTPNAAPFFGRTVCMPTTSPATDTERTYASVGECELALMQLPPQQDYVPISTGTACNEYGCFNEVQWGRTPGLTTICVDNSGTCGPSLQLGQRVGVRGDCAQYGFEN